jgi:hypothetical protein
LAVTLVVAPVYASEAPSDCNQCYVKMITQLKDKHQKLVEECCKLTDSARVQKEAEIREVEESILYLEELNTGRNIIEKIKGLETKTWIAIAAGTIGTLAGAFAIYKFAQWISNLKSTNGELKEERARLITTLQQQRTEIGQYQVQITGLNNLVVPMGQQLGKAQDDARNLAARLIQQEQKYKQMDEDTKKLDAIVKEVQKKQPKLLKKIVQKYYTEFKKDKKELKKVVNDPSAKKEQVEVIIEKKNEEPKKIDDKKLEKK